MNNKKMHEVMDQLVARVQLLSEGWQRPDPLPAPRPVLRLVHDDRSRPRVQRNIGADPHEAEMRTYARTIRAFREEEDGASDCAKVRPKLTLVYSRAPQRFSL